MNFTTSERAELDRVAAHHGKSASDLIRGLIAEEGARILFDGLEDSHALRVEIGRLKAFEGRVARLSLERADGPELLAGILNAIEILNDERDGSQ